MRKIITAVVAPLLLALNAFPSVAAPVFTQAYDGSGKVETSQDNSTFMGDPIPSYKVYDNFSLGTATSINRVRWTGGFFTVDGTTDFLIQFWKNTDGGMPGSELIPTPTFSGSVKKGVPSVVGGVTLYDYEVDLATAFVAEASKTYWMSIQAKSALPPQWGWARGSRGLVGDGRSYQDNVLQEFDLAFSLSNTPSNVPEPGSLLLAGLALAALAGTSRTRKAG